MKNAANIFHAAALAALIAGTSAPAFAADAEQKLTHDPKSDKYCHKSWNTGSRIEKTVCRTRKEWTDLGVEFPKRAETAMTGK